jgi:hypothetical protein
MPAFTDYHAVADHNRPYQRVRCGGVAPMLGELVGALHETVASHSFLSPIRTLTVGAGLRLSLSLHRLNPRVIPRGRGLSAGALVSLGDSPPVREFHPPPKVT